MLAKALFIKLVHYLNYTITDLIQYPDYFFLQKLGRFNIVRNWVSQYRSSSVETVQVSQYGPSALFSDLDEQEVVNHLYQDGIFTGLMLPTHILIELQKFALEAYCFGDRNPKWGFLYEDYAAAQDAVQQEFTMAGYYNVDDSCSTIQKVIRDPALVKIAAAYLRTPPVFTGATLWWSFQKKKVSSQIEKAQAAQVFHCDIDDYRAVRFFFYLTDVDETSGPHVYIKGSHTKKNFVAQLLRGRTTEKSLLKFYDQDKFVQLQGPEGWGFAEDSFGYHKGTPPTHHDRLLLVLKFATHNYGRNRDKINCDDLQIIESLKV